jgi:adenylate kinase family enzyme
MTPHVHLMLGLPGSGKTTLSLKLSEDLSLPRFSLDEEYFLVVRNTQQSERDFAIEAQVETKIKDRVAALVRQGTSVVLDFCPWGIMKRGEFYSFITSHGGIPQVHYLPVEREELMRRLEQRNTLRDERYQYMSAEMLGDFCRNFEPPVADEGPYMVKG